MAPNLHTIFEHFNRVSVHVYSNMHVHVHVQNYYANIILTVATIYVHAIIMLFMQMSLFFMWSVAKQRYLVDRAKTIEFLIQASAECKQLNNFSTLLQLMSALEHGSVQRYKTAWELIPKNVSSLYVVISKFSYNFSFCTALVIFFQILDLFYI